jgi:hypothetical protein
VEMRDRDKEIKRHCLIGRTVSWSAFSRLTLTFDPICRFRCVIPELF